MQTISGSLNGTTTPGLLSLNQYAETDVEITILDLPDGANVLEIYLSITKDLNGPDSVAYFFQGISDITVDGATATATINVPSGAFSGLKPPINCWYAVKAILDSGPVTSDDLQGRARIGQPGIIADTTDLMTPAFRARVLDCLYNPNGLRRFYTSLWMCGIGMGGVDVQCIGDSTTWGTGSGVNAITQSWPSVLKVGLQSALNPASVPGGYGWIPFDYQFLNGTGLGNPNLATAGSGDWDIFSPYSTSTVSPDVGGGLGLLLIHSQHNPASYALFDFAGADATDAVLKKQAATHYRLTGTAFGTPTVDLYPVPGNTTPVTPGTGSYGHYADACVGANTYNRIGPVRTVNGGVSPPSNWRFQLQNGAGADNLYVSGLMLFNGDVNAGIRVHNFGVALTSAYEWATAVNSFGSATDGSAGIPGCAHHMLATASPDGTSIAASGGNNTRCITIELGLNDFATARSVSQYQANIQTLVTAALSFNSRPSVLLLAQLPRFESPHQNCFQVWEQWIGALKAIVDANPSAVALLDLWKMANYGRPDTGVPATLGLMNSDQVHQSVFGYEWVAAAVQNVLTMSQAGFV